MWIIGVPVELTKQLYPQYKTYTNDTFLVFHTIAKYTLISVQLVLSLLAIWLLATVFRKDNRITKPYVLALASISLLSFEPFFVGNSRLLHMDVLFTLLAFVSLCAGYLATHTTASKQAFLFSGLTGILIGFAFLT